MLIMVLAGMFFVGLGAWVGQSNNVVERLKLDTSGTRGVAIAEPFGPNEYRLRLSLDSAIYARVYKGVLPGASSDTTKEFSIPVAYDPAQPGHFLPAGLSYLPAFGAGSLFILGMAFVLFARRATVVAVRMQQLSQARADEERRRKAKKKSKHRHHRERSRSHGDVHRPA